MRAPVAIALAAAVAVAGCYERGKAEPAQTASKDAAPVAVARAVRRHADPPGPGDPGATIAIALEAEPAHLNPLLGDAVAGRIALGDIYESLVCDGADQTDPATAPCLARSAEISADGKTWSFELRRGVVWHDGRAFSARDVAFTFRLLSGRSPAPSVLAADFDDLEAIDVEGDRVILRFGSFRIGRRGTIARVPILPAHRFADVKPAKLASAAASRQPIGTGPLRFVGWKPGESIELARNDSYWGEPAGAARVVHRLLSSRSLVLAGLRSGELDLALQLPIDEAIDTASTARALGLFSYPLPAYLVAVYNARRSALAEPEVRRALTMLLDRSEIVRELIGGQAVAISGPFLPDSPENAPDVLPIPFSPAGAARLLGARRPSVQLAVPSGSRTMGRIADIWAEDARPHASLEVIQVPYADLVERARAGEFDIALLSLTTERDADVYHRFHSSQIGEQNFSGLSDRELDRLLETARREPDLARRDRIRQTIHRRLHELAPCAFIATDTRVGLASDSVGGIAIGPYGPVARGLRKRAGDRQ